MKHIWVHDGGEMLCQKHAGITLTWAIEDQPRARLLRTTQGTWQRLTANDQAYLRGRLGTDELCEGCNRQS